MVIIPRYSMGFLLLGGLCRRRGQGCCCCWASPSPLSPPGSSSTEVVLPEALRGHHLPTSMQGIVRHQLAPGSVVNLTANVGEVIEVSLVGNPTTGYSWQDADRRGSIEVQTSTGSQPGAHPENSDSGHETIVSKNGLERRLSSSSFTVENASMVVRYLAQVFKVNPHPLGYVGTGGIYYFYYQAVRPGYCQLRFVYTRPWEHVPIPEEHYARVNIRVLDTTINGTEVERVQIPEDSTASQMYVIL